MSSDFPGVKPNLSLDIFQINTQRLLRRINWNLEASCKPVGWQHCSIVGTSLFLSKKKYITVFFDVQVSSVIRGCPLLETLELLGLVKLTSGPLSDDLHLRLPRLTWLDLQQCPNVDDETLAPLVEKQPRGLHLISYYGEVVCPQSKKGAGGEESKEEDQ